MKHCENCQRELQPGEQKHCPACAANRSHKIRRCVEIAAGVAGLLVIAGKAWAKRAEK